MRYILTASPTFAVRPVDQDLVYLVSAADTRLRQQFTTVTEDKTRSSENVDILRKA